MTTIHAQSWLAGINAPSTLEGCVCGWKVERSSILASEKQYEQHVADVLQGQSGSPAPRIEAQGLVVDVDSKFDDTLDLDDEDTLAGADAERAALADAAQAAQARPLNAKESAAVDAAQMMARASEAAVEVAQGPAASILTSGDRYKRALLCQLLEAQFIAGAAFGAQRACAFVAETMGDASRASTSAGAKR